MKVTISVVWLIFALMFFFLGLYHWNASEKDVPLFKLSERPGKNWGSIKVLGSDVDQPVKDFAQDFNNYLDEQNRLSKKQNQRSAFGYWLASLTALVSIFLELKK